MIRPAAEKDFEPIMEIMLSPAVNKYFVLEKNASLEEKKERWSRMKDNMVVFEENGKVIAFFCYHDFKGHRRHTLEIGPLGVLPSEFRKGVGTQLFNYLLDKFKKDKMRIQCSIVEGNPAIEFYKKLGFTEEWTKKDSVIIDGKLKDEIFLAYFITSLNTWLKRNLKAGKDKTKGQKEK